MKLKKKLAQKKSGIQLFHSYNASNVGKNIHEPVCCQEENGILKYKSKFSKA